MIRLRAAGGLVVLTAALYVPWLFSSINPTQPVLGAVFVAANLLLIATLVVTVGNNWHRSEPVRLSVAAGEEPRVAVIIPSCGEPVAMVRRTARSVLDQDWPAEQLCVVLSDDAGDPAIAELARDLRREWPAATVLYNRAPVKESPERRGEAKAGNLNSALDLLDQRHERILFVETRDADDEVGDRSFLRQTVALLVADHGLAYVQTTKTAQVAPGDPFGNLDPLFYQGSMRARHAANAVFPCGSGLVWRRWALDHIGGFPSWNLVEDLQSGVEALKRGWRGAYLPIVGARAQHAPEDLPNMYKQRGTWALDTLRLLIWGGLRGLSPRQRLHFWELGLFYLQSWALITFAVVPVIALAFGLYPLQTTHWEYARHFWPFAVAIELFLAALNGRERYEHLWRARQLWFGLVPVYARASLLAVAGGRHRKPRYVVTRKTTETALHWRQVVPHVVVLVLLLGSLGRAVASGDVLRDLDLGSAYWAAFTLVFLGSFIAKAWHGWSPLRALAARRTRDRAHVPAHLAPPARVIDLRDRLGEPSRQAS